MNARHKPTGFTRLLRASAILPRISQVWREEAAFRQEVGLSLLVIPGGLYLGRSGLERALLVSRC